MNTLASRYILPRYSGVYTDSVKLDLTTISRQYWKDRKKLDKTPELLCNPLQKHEENNLV